MSEADNNPCMAMGTESAAIGENCIALGKESYAKGKCAIAIGNGARAVGDFAIAIGNNVVSVGHGIINIRITPEGMNEFMKEIRFVVETFLGIPSTSIQELERIVVKSQKLSKLNKKEDV